MMRPLSGAHASRLRMKTASAPSNKFLVIFLTRKSLHRILGKRLAKRGKQRDGTLVLRGFSPRSSGERRPIAGLPITMAF